MTATPASLAWLRALVEPHSVLSWSLQDWDRAVRLARRNRLLARLAHVIDRAGLTDDVPLAVRRHLAGARQLSQARTRAMLWVIDQLPKMLDHSVHPLVLLKGAAYVGQGLPIAEGRMPSDLDILVPRQKLPEVQFRLMQAGWQEPPLDDHDRRYYMEWSHELPPLQHRRHAMELDVHHNILPQRAGQTIDAGLLFEGLRPSRWPQWQVLSPVDQVLHSAAHLFFDAEPRDRVRDLVDMDGLFRHFGAEPTFWDDLLQRAHRLGLVEPLAMACHFTGAWLNTAVPAAVKTALAEAGPGRAKRMWLLPLMEAVLLPAEPDRMDSLGKRVSVTAALTRYHWNRLPLRILVPHLWRKWRAGHAQAAQTASEGQANPP